MVDRVEIIGERYQGQFIASVRYTTEAKGSCETRRDIDVCYYEGTGAINVPEGQKLVFAFRTFTFEPSYYNRRLLDLEQAIVGFDKTTPTDWKGSPIIEYSMLEGFYPKVVDLSLEQLSEQVLISTDLIPLVHTVRLNKDYLVQKKVGL